MEDSTQLLKSLPKLGGTTHSWEEPGLGIFESCQTMGTAGDRESGHGQKLLTILQARAYQRAWIRHRGPRNEARVDKMLSKEYSGCGRRWGI